MLIVAYLIAAAHIVLCIACLIARPGRKNWSNEKVVYLPFFLAGVGILFGTILSIPTIVCAMTGNWMFAFFGAAVLGTDCMMTAYLNCVIRYDDDGFTARNFFGIRRTCSYAQVEGVRFGRDSRIYFQGHSVFIDEMSCGSDEFIGALDKGHKKATGRWVPCYKRKWDPMNGHLEHPWGYFILWVAMGLCCAALPIFMWWSMTSETDPSEITVHQVQFYRYELKSGDLRLYVRGEEQPYKIGFFRHYGDSIPTPEGLCSGEIYSVGVEGERRYVVTLTGANGAKYITLESERQNYRDSQRSTVWPLVIVCLVGLYICYMGIAVARHPERYSKTVRRLFYKDGYLI